VDKEEKQMRIKDGKGGDIKTGHGSGCVLSVCDICGGAIYALTMKSGDERTTPVIKYVCDGCGDTAYVTAQTIMENE